MLARTIRPDNDPNGLLLESLEAELRSVGLRTDWVKSAAMSGVALRRECLELRRRCEVVLGELDALARPDLRLVLGGRH